MINYKYINNKLEGIHNEYYSNYWDNLINNTLYKMKEIEKKQSSFYFDNKVNKFIKQQLVSLKDDTEKRKFYF